MIENKSIYIYLINKLKQASVSQEQEDGISAGAEPDLDVLVPGGWIFCKKIKCKWWIGWESFDGDKQWQNYLKFCRYIHRNDNFSSKSTAKYWALSKVSFRDQTSSTAATSSSAASYTPGLAHLAVPCARPGGAPERATSPCPSTLSSAPTPEPTPTHRRHELISCRKLAEN